MRRTLRRSSATSASADSRSAAAQLFCAWKGLHTSVRGARRRRKPPCRGPFHGFGARQSARHSCVPRATCRTWRQCAPSRAASRCPGWATSTWTARGKRGTPPALPTTSSESLPSRRVSMGCSALLSVPKLLSPATPARCQ